ncbi:MULTISPECIES: zinc-dependent alcohol dehydrogenase family protein [Enterobacter cloacae complex]|uniref:zinc-dependent alcohol dehydrogenase family protein n=1 Tax=Enterobacter cloacae complex TaxID=354276 RepID=UPI00097C50A5|nr:NAD(P)-dependent alcohol dehydrogenase [Enterobacter chengduensis]MBT1936802.1 NAD(P)-dependent alcohol dehydrogenase [Enterobacter chengduensis]MBT1965149.1 NAD(P)-dependent alcohol dehydrogenase [Enterobacter chengduensis]MCK7172123.1 NAD(P)-dependent alcohol dehydrogenase [Enterobacter chengduensis]MCM7674910.1 NAD(P)-dependent alcohol dehydrogenase [Enterobacter chengduensis]MCM8034153.1 NAD(P)-dependent alcohol dehydrogenase [Enterobacter chengduensis]
MQAVVLNSPGGLENVRLKQLPDPGKPGYGQIRVALHATSLNFHDLLVASGAVPSADQRILMADGAGIVEATGEGVSEFRPGDRVISTFFPQWPDGTPFESVGDFQLTPGDGCDGFATEYVIRPASHFTHSPQGWSHAEAATLTTSGLTAWRALVVDAKLKAGDTVLTLGTGGVSVTALQIAKSMGAKVIATSSSDEKLARLGELGADHLINYRTNPQWGKTVKEITNGRGADVIVEIGGPGTLTQSIEAVRIGGHIALIGVLTGTEGTVPTAMLMAKQANLKGLIVGSRRMQQDLVSAMNQTGIRPVISDQFTGLSSIVDALCHMAGKKHFGKITVEW